MAAVCVFCGAREGNDGQFLRAAARTAALLTTRQHRVIYGGGSTGMMGAVADEVLRLQGHITGVIPESLATIELMHTAVADMRVVPDMHARKALMHQLADGYIALPGGYGTMEELFEVLCWAQLDFHAHPVALLNINGYYDGLISLLHQMVEQGFLDTRSLQLLTACRDTVELEEWLTRSFAGEGSSADAGTLPAATETSDE